MRPVDQLRHMLFAFWHHEPEFFEDELQEIVSAIKEGRSYDNCPQLSVYELKQALNELVQDLDEMVIHERTLRLTIRNILLNR